MTKSNMRFYRLYNRDGSCKVICMDCYENLGTLPDRDAVALRETEHICGAWMQAMVVPVAGGEDASREEARASEAASLSLMERALKRIHPALLLPLTAILLYGIPTAVEILARREVNTWVSIILPGNALGCATLMTVMRRPRTGLLLYLVLAACECWLHITHAMRGMTMAWLVDLVPTLVVLALMMGRLHRFRGMGRAAFS
ncbi:MAG: hypothetical protein ACLGXA_02130 [Acidobacteriota bacterium]